MKISCFILGVLSLAAYSQDLPDTPNELELPLSSSFFGLDLFKHMKYIGGNVLISPLSAHSALSMVYSGSSNETAQEMASVLRMKPGSPTENTRGYATFLKKVLKAQDGVTLRLANRLYADKTRKVKESFKKFVKDNFLADAVELDFQGEPAKCRETINKWVEEQTNNKIHDLVTKDGVSSDTLSVLVNALYFKGNWSVAFPKENTRPRPFKPDNWTRTEVDMMSVTDSFNYAKFPEFEALSLNYQGNDTSFVILLPTDVEGLPKLEAALADLEWDEIEKQMAHKREMTVTLPKFKSEMYLNLIFALKEFGMKRAFDPEGAQFPELSEYPMHLSKVIQTAFLEIDETGTEAAAGTWTGGFGVVSDRLIPEFTADHPFLFFVWHKPSQTVLFIGTGGFGVVSDRLIPEFTADHPFLFFVWHKPSQTVLFIGAGGAMKLSLRLYPKFTADHPFLFFIWHKPSQTVLFIGRYSEPR